MVAADDSGGVRNLRLESDGNKVAGRLDGDVPRPGRMTILGTIDRPTSIRLRFVLGIPGLGEGFQDIMQRRHWGDFFQIHVFGRTVSPTTVGLDQFYKLVPDHLLIDDRIPLELLHRCFGRFWLGKCVVGRRRRQEGRVITRTLISRESRRRP